MSKLSRTDLRIKEMSEKEFVLLFTVLVVLSILSACLWQFGRHVGFLTPAQRVYTVKERVYYV